MLKTKDFKFELKAVEDKEGTIAGRASVYGVVDAHNDVVMPGAFAASLKENGGIVPILNQHNTHDPIGLATLADSPDALLVSEGVLELGLQSARDAYLRAKKGLVSGISIGYETLREEFKGSIRQLHEIKLWEVSLVTFPANGFARVTHVKDALAQSVDFEFVGWAHAEAKAGRTLSAANMGRLSAAMSAIMAALSEMQAMLDAANPAPAEEEAASAEIGAEMKSLGSLMADIRRTITA